MSKTIKQIKVPDGVNNDKTVYPGGYTMVDFYRKITSMEATYSRVESEYKKCRKNYENYQAPDNKPPGKVYITENLSTDLVRGLEGQLIGGRILPKITGLGSMEQPIIELHDDIIMRANKFNKAKLEPMSNHFYVEGKCSIVVDYNPYRKSQYGVGVPEIHIAKPHEGLWDNNISSMHEDDIFRCLRKWCPVKEIEQEFELEPGSLSSVGDTFEGVDTQDDVVRYGNLYSLEYYVKTFEPVDGKGNFITREKEQNDEAWEIVREKNPLVECKTFYIVKIWDRSTIVRQPKKTGFSIHTIQPVIHTQRMETTTEPMGILHLTNQKQTNLNVVKSIMYEAVTQEIKNLLVIAGATAAEQRKLRRESKKIDGTVALNNPQARVFEVKGRGLATALIQWFEMERRGFDEISGRYAPEKGAVDGNLSGRAVIALQNRGAVPELVAKNHLELPLTNMSILIIECIAKKMTSMPFAIERQIEGKKRKIYYNTKVTDIPKEDLQAIMQEDPYSVITVENDLDDSAIHMVNDLRRVDFDSVDLEIEIVMNVLGWEQNEANKALLAFQNGLVSQLDTLKKLYPSEWKQLHENNLQEKQALALVQKLGEIGEEVIPVMSKAADLMLKARDSSDEIESEMLNEQATQVLEGAMTNIKTNGAN